jgi:hypothetical protein
MDLFFFRSLNSLFSRDEFNNVMKNPALNKPGLHLEELNLKYEADKPAKYAYRARVPGGWLIFIWTPGRSGVNGVTFYPDPNHTWSGGTQEA